MESQRVRHNLVTEKQQNPGDAETRTLVSWADKSAIKGMPEIDLNHFMIKVISQSGNLLDFIDEMVLNKLIEHLWK